jgi:homocysteine S-methyltransferase
MDFQEAMASEPFILAEGAVIERLRRNPSVSLDPHVVHAGLVYDARAITALEDVYRGYLDVGRDHDLPMIVLTPTWRASSTRLARAGFKSSDDVNGDCSRFVLGLLGEYGDYASKVFAGGLMGCLGDAYKPEEALPQDEARSIHRFQAQALAEAGVDFLMAATLPALSEARGIAMAMADAGLPYILSFVVRPTGTLLDATPLHKAISTIDSAVFPNPLCYMVNCVHPTVFAQALAHEWTVSEATGHRAIGLQANTSSKAPEELDNLACLESEEPDAFADAMIQLYERFGTKVLGGCCGTDRRHIERIAGRIAERIGL